MQNSMTMNRVGFLCLLCAVLSSSLLEYVDAQDSWNVIKSIDALTKSVNDLQTKIDMQASVLNNFVTKEELESILLNNLASKSDMQMQGTYLKSLEAKAERHENALINLEAKLDAQHASLINLNTKDDEQVASLSKLELQTDMQVNVLKKMDTDLGNQTNLINNLTTKVELEATLLNSLGDNITQGFADVKEILSRKSKCALSSSLTKGVVEGIIAGTYSGVLIIPLDSREPRNISSTTTAGVAFDWITRKIYWIENKVGIKRVNLNGSSVELLISDASDLRGLAVDPITGNFYYGEKGSNAKIRVCNSNGKHCAAIVSGADTVGKHIWDIALFPSEGLMFWSSPDDKRAVFRANMDGTNTTGYITENVVGLHLEEVSQRLYWANYGKKTIGNHDLSEKNPNILVNTTFTPYDVDVDGDTMYFGTQSSAGIYFATQNGIVSLITNTTAAHCFVRKGKSALSSKSMQKLPLCKYLCTDSGFIYLFVACIEHMHGSQYGVLCCC